jgi:hypothetical protein
MGLTQGRLYHVTPHLMIKDHTTDAGMSNNAPLGVILNFLDELKRLASAKR